MQKISCALLLMFLWISSIATGDGIKGFWIAPDDKTKQPKSVIAVYPYEGRYYGKIIGIFNKEREIVDTIYHPISKARAMAGDPFYCGLDVVMEMSPKNDGTWRGHVLDPRSGNVYRAELWRKGQNLVLRGKYLVFGKNVTWPPFPDSHFTPSFKKPDLSTLVPYQNSRQRIENVTP